MIGNPMDLPETTHSPESPPAFVEDAEILAEIRAATRGILMPWSTGTRFG